jgi:uncharacterized protein (TIGR02421 family)
MSPVLATEDLAVDRQLAEISERFRFLLDLTPVDAADARARFLDSTDGEPDFRYRPLEDQPEVLRAEVDAVDVESVADHTLAHLVQAKRRELELQIEMLAARGTSEFLALAIELYGTVGPALLAEAQAILRALDGAPAPSSDGHLDADQLARLAERELDHYRATAPDLSAHVEVRADAGSVMVANGDLLIPPTTQVPRARVTALLQHEIGTHVLTYVNGCHQPVRLLAAGLAGYEETQEGLALIAEWVSGVFSPARLRQVAARVVAVHHMVDGATFRDVHDELVTAGFSPTAAFGITMRVFRSGGLTKDLVYLRGLGDLVAHVHAGNGLDALWLGKMPLAAVPLVEELRDRSVLTEPLLRPRYLDEPSAARRLARLARAETVLDLVEG